MKEFQNDKRKDREKTKKTNASRKKERKISEREEASEDYWSIPKKCRGFQWIKAYKRQK